jgi:hypothetical protein
MEGVPVGRLVVTLDGRNFEIFGVDAMSFWEPKRVFLLRDLETGETVHVDADEFPLEEAEVRV